MSFFKKQIDFGNHPRLQGKTEDEVIELMLEAARGDAVQADNPFFSETRQWCLWRELALWLHTPEEPIDLSGEEWISVERLVRRDLQRTPMSIHPIAASAPSMGHLFQLFFNDLAENLSYSWGSIYEYATRGVPFYRLSNGEYVMMPRNDPTLCFLRHMGEYLIRTRDECFPSWARDIYLRGEHIKAYRLFLGNDHKEEDRPALVRAMLTHIGMPADIGASTPRDVGQSHLWEIALECKQKFWSDEAREINANPKATEIVDWLMEQFDLSGRQASAIEIVVRPRGAS